LISQIISLASTASLSTPNGTIGRAQKERLRLNVLSAGSRIVPDRTLFKISEFGANIAAEVQQG
jgi:hypothetical protein